MDERTRDALRLVLLTGMRPGEVLGLRRRDIDLSATFVDRRGGAERTRGHGLVTLKDTKNGSIRTVTLSPQARAVMATALGGADAVRDAYVFAADAETPKPMETPTLARAMSRRADVFGDLTPHRLRAVCAFLVERLGFGSAIASDVLGHIDGSVLRRAYSGFDGLPARLDALEAVGVEIERIAGQKTDMPVELGRDRAPDTESVSMNVDEAVEVLKAQDPHLLVMLAELCAAVKAVKTANNQESARRRMEDAVVQLVKASGADDELLESQIKEASNATRSTGKSITRADLDNANLGFDDGGIAFIQAAFRRHLISLPLGIAGTAAGLATVGSLGAAKEGHKPWLLFGRAKNPGGDISVEAGIERQVIDAVLAEAARLIVHSGLSRRNAIVKAVAARGAIAIDNGIKLDPELRPVRSSRSAKTAVNKLHAYFEDQLEHERAQKSDRRRAR